MTQRKSLILVIEDEEDLLLGLQHNLQFEGFQTMVARTGREGLEKSLSGMPDLVLLDIMLPEMDGFEVLRTLRDHNRRTPVILLTSKSLESDKLEGFALGADDYVTKPFSIQELLARVHAVLERAKPHEVELDVLEIGDLRLDFTRHKVTRAGQELDLALKEFEILHLLVRNRGEIISRERLLRDVWGYNPDRFPETRTVDNHIAKLRSKIGQSCIETVPKVGYRFTN